MNILVDFLVLRPFCQKIGSFLEYLSFFKYGYIVYNFITTFHSGSNCKSKQCVSLIFVAVLGYFTKNWLSYSKNLIFF